MAGGMTHRIKRAVQKSDQPSPLLRFLAGPHAEAIASVWPAPHQDFLALPAARRHAAAILLARDARGPADIASTVQRQRDAALARLLVGDGEKRGLMKALGRMGETLWRGDQYDRFLVLFDQPAANRILRHMGTLHPTQLSVVHALPPLLHEATVVAKVPNLQAARDLALALDLADRIHGFGASKALAKALIQADTSASLFNKAANGLSVERFGGPLPQPVLPAPFVAVTSSTALEKIALEFQNCLRDFRHDMVVGRMAVYRWNGQPNVVLALRWDPAGWRLAEAETHANGESPDHVLREIVEALSLAHVRTGPSAFTLGHRLRRHPHGDGEPVGESWRDQLELGELWD